MKTGHRIRLYFFGFLIGSVLVYFILFRGRNHTYWFPENRVKEQLIKGRLFFTEHARCRMQCRGISEEEVKEILYNGNVNFSESHPHPSSSSGQALCPTYAMEGTTADKQTVRIIFASCDTLTTKVITAINLGMEKDTCDCK